MDLMKLITTADGRDKLAPSVNGAPYFVKVGAGQYLGLRKSADGKQIWCARVRVKLADGKHEQRHATLGGFADYAQALAAAWDFFAQEQGARPRAQRLSTVAEVCAKHMEHMRLTKAKDEEKIRRAECMLGNAVNDALGALDPEKLNALDVTEWRARLIRGERGHSDQRGSMSATRVLRPIKPQSVNRIKKQLFSALSWAADSGLLKNRGWYISSNLAEVDVEEGKFIEPKHREQLRGAATGNYADYLTCIMSTGARPIELERCTRADLDLTKSVATIKLVTFKGRGGKRRERRCAIPQQARGAFERFAKGKLPLAPLFTREDAQQWPAGRGSVSALFTALAAECGLEYSLYDTRHTRIATMLAAGVDAQSVAESCGTSLQVIDRHYRKYLPDDAAAKVAAVAI